MDITSVIVAIVGAIATTLCAYIAIVPQIKKNKIDVTDIKKVVNEAIDESGSMKAIKAGLVSEMRKSLSEQYWNYADRGFDLSQSEIDEWKDDVKKYKELGGNGLITEFDNSIQMALAERARAKNDKRVRKL